MHDRCDVVLIALPPPAWYIVKNFPVPCLELVNGEHMDESLEICDYLYRDNPANAEDKQLMKDFNRVTEAFRNVIHLYKIWEE